MRDVHVDVVRLADELVAEGLGGEALTGHDDARMLHEHAENLELPVGELDRLSVCRHLAALDVEGDPLDNDGLALGGLGFSFRRLPALERDANPRQQLLDGEGFGDVVVRSRVEAGDLVHHGVSRGEHDDGRRLLAADTAEDLHAVELGEEYVEKNQVVVTGEGQLDAGPAVGRLVHLVALVLELELDEARDLLLVLYDQDPSHSW